MRDDDTISYAVCEDCWAVYNDWHGLEPEELEPIERALLDLTPVNGLLVPGEGDPEFSWCPCECCGSHLGGDRHELIAVTLEDNHGPA